MDLTPRTDEFTNEMCNRIASILPGHLELLQLEIWPTTLDGDILVNMVLRTKVST